MAFGNNKRTLFKIRGLQAQLERSHLPDALADKVAQEMRSLATSVNPEDLSPIQHAQLGSAFNNQSALDFMNS